MSSAVIIYGSTTGNTAVAAETIEDYLSRNAYDVTLKNVSDTGTGVFKEAYDLYLLGCSTWGEDEIELQEDFESFYEDMDGSVPLDGKKFAVFGYGDSSYTYFCGAVDVIEDRIGRLGGRLVCDALRIDGEPEDDVVILGVEV